MSVLSSPQGFPERIRALANLLVTEGKLTRKILEQWLVPDAIGEKKATTIGNTMAAARSLDLIVETGDCVEASPDLACIDHLRFSDLIHRRLCLTETPEDKVIMQIFSYIILRHEQEQTLDWFVSKSVNELSDSINSVLSLMAERKDMADRAFNATKFSAWKTWAVHLGLGWDNFASDSKFDPDICRRLQRVVIDIFRDRNTENSDNDIQIEAPLLVDDIVKHMPYLDSGKIFDTVAHAFGQYQRFTKPSMPLSRIFSQGLRDLVEEGFIQLHAASDRPGQIIQIQSDPTSKIFPGGLIGEVTLCAERCAYV